MKTNLWLLLFIFGLLACGNNTPKDNKNENNLTADEAIIREKTSKIDDWIDMTDINRGDLEREEINAECRVGWGRLVKKSSARGLQKLMIDTWSEHGGTTIYYYFDAEQNLVAVGEIKSSHTISKSIAEETRFYLREGKVFATNYRKSEVKPKEGLNLREQAFEAIINSAQAFSQYEKDLPQYKALTAETFKGFVCN